MDHLRLKVEKVLTEKKICYLATSDRQFVDIAAIAYYSEGLTLYFGTFRDTLKSRNTAVLEQVAVGLDNLQIHGRITPIPDNSQEYREVVPKYLTKFPKYRHYFETEGNVFYKIEPLVIWVYDSSQGKMHRERLVMDQSYYEALNPYVTPKEFNSKELPWLDDKKKY